MKLKELPIYLDLFRLPFPALVNRVRQRVFEKQKERPKFEVHGDLSWRKLKNFSFKFPQPNKRKCKVLLNHYRNDEFNYLGSGWISLRNKYRPKGFLHWKYNERRENLKEDELDWNRDQRTAYLFEIGGVPQVELQKALKEEGVDVKFCWEFARMHHLPQLAWWYYSLPDYKTETLNTYRKHLSSFMDQCPVGKGIHWSSPMEVAIRISNILISFFWLRDHLKDVEERVLEYAYGHFSYIDAHLEYKDDLGTNHYLSNLMGLVVCGFFINNSRIEKRAEWAWVEMEREIEKQFFEDGFNFEYSTYYHRLSTEMVLLAINFAAKRGYAIKAKTKEIIGRALQNIIQLKTNDNVLPVFGDTDSGRIIDFEPEGDLDEVNFWPKSEKCGFIDELNNDGSIYQWFYGDALQHLNTTYSTFSNSTVLTTSEKQGLKFKNEWKIEYAGIKKSEINLHLWKQAGIVLYKSTSFYLAVDLMANPKGHRYRGHLHNSKGGFVLQVHGINYISDPGMLTYTASVELRNQYRQTAAHPVPYTGIEQNRYLNGFLGLFHCRLDVSVKILGIGADYLKCYITYRGVKILRRFEIHDSYLLIIDECNKPFVINKNENIEMSKGYGRLR